MRVAWLVGLCVTALLAEPAMLPREPVAVPLQRVTVVAADAAVGEPIAAAVREAGGQATVIAPAAALATRLKWRPELAAQTVILVGSLVDNPALLPLYGRYLSFADAAYPGGWAVRTAPRPFGPEGAAVVVDASDAAGAQAGAARLAELIRAAHGALGPTVEVHLSPEAERRGRTAWLPAHRYALTGAPALVAEEVARLDKALQPERGWADLGDYGLEEYLREYALIQDALSSADQQRFDQAILRTLLTTQSEYWRARNGNAIGGRHQAMGTSAFALGVELLLRRGTPNPEAKALLERWWAEVSAYWRNALTAYHDDIEGVTSYWAVEPKIDWAFYFGDEAFFDQVLPLALLRTLTATDNLGAYAGTGTYEECRPGDLMKRLPLAWAFHVGAFFHPDDGDLALADRLMTASQSTWAVSRCWGGMRMLLTGRPPAPLPGARLGVVSLPLGTYRWDRLAHTLAEGKTEGLQWTPGPQERCYEKLCLRSDWTPQGQYLVFQGFEPPYADNVPARDGNELTRYVDLGHVWLHSNSETSGPLDRTAVTCTDGADHGTHAAAAVIDAEHNGRRVGLVASRLAGLSGGDWTRHVFWRRERYTALIDVVQQTRPGTYRLICTFRSPQHAELAPDGMTAFEGDARLHVRSADAVPLTLEGGEEPEGAAIPRLLRETQALDGGPGTAKAFRNLLYAEDPAHPAELELRPLGDRAVLVRGTTRGDAELALLAVGDEQGVRVGPFGTTARMLYVGASDWAVAGGDGLRLGEQALTGAEGDSPAAFRAALEALWTAAKPAEHPAAGGAAEPPRLAWRCEPFTPVLPDVPAPLLTSDPAPADGAIGTLFDRIVPREATVRWPDGPLRLTLDLHQVRDVAAIELAAGQVGPFNNLVDPAKLPAPRPVDVELSDDGFAQDVRRLTTTLRPAVTYEVEHKGSVFGILRWLGDPVGQQARYLRLSFDPQVWHALAINELTVRQAGPSAVRCVDAVTGRLGATPVVLAWSDQNELAALRTDGTLLWRASFPGHVTAAITTPELGAAGPAVLATTTEAGLHALDATGKELWQVNFLDSGRLNADLPTGYSIGLLPRPDAAPLIVTGNYDMAAFTAPEGKVLSYVRLPGAFYTAMLPHGSDVDGDTVAETAALEVWGALSFLDSSLKSRGSVLVPRGRTLALAPNRPGQLLTCTSGGLAAVEVATRRALWRREVSPLTACAVFANQPGQGRIAVGKGDGFVLVFDQDGALQHTVAVGGTVRAMAAAPGPNGHRLVVALPDRLVSLDTADATVKPLATGSFRRLIPTGEPGRLLAVSGGAMASLTLPER